MCAVDFTVRQFLLPLVSSLEQSGYDVTIACSRGPYFEEIQARGFRLVENPVSRSFSIPAHLRSIWKTYQLIRREKFDVVHVHTPIAALIGRLAAKLAGVPVKIYTAHGFYFHDAMPAAKRSFHVALEKLGSACGDFIMTVSAEDEAVAKKLGIAKAGKVETIYNGIDTTHFDPARFSPEERKRLRDEAQISEGAFVIGFVGRLVREKGLFELFDAVHQLTSRFPSLHLLIVGDTLPSDHDGSKNEIVQRVDELGLRSRVTFAGLVEDTAPWLACMDVFALPSYREGMPVSLLEAMGMELPCIATNIRGCREEIEDGTSGLLVEPRNAQALASAMEFVAGDDLLREEISTAARERVLQHFNIVTVVEHQLKIYERLIATRLENKK